MLPLFSMVPNRIPRHIAIIPDGNRRWAKAQGLPPFMGHFHGHEATKKLLPVMIERGVEEVTFLMDIFYKALTEEINLYVDQGIRLRVLGDRNDLAPRLVKAIEDAELKTAGGTVGQFNLCINYGGRAEIVAAVQKLIRDGV